MPAGPPLLRGSLLLLFLLHFLGAPARGAVYTNHFLVELYDGGQAEAERVAAEHGFGGVRKLPFLDSGYFFYHNGLAKARRRRSLQHKLRLEKDSRDALLEQLRVLRVGAWWLRAAAAAGWLQAPSALSGKQWSTRLSRRQAASGEVAKQSGTGCGQRRQLGKKQDRREKKVRKAVQQEGFSRRKRGYRDINDIDINMNDPLFTKQWYLINTGQADGTPGLDLNVAEAWELGYTGKGVTIGIMDDGIDYLHPDLASNYNAKASYDFSSNDPYPYPRYTDDWFNSHGTRCAGEVSAAANNNICGVGVAYNSKVAGIRMLDQPFMTDIIEASSISHMPQVIDIYSASWGPTDNGKTVDGPRELTLQAMADGVNKGRGGKGSIYVWASGDGGSYDDCNCDGYASSMWTISINSAINDGRTALYDESCSSTLASTFSNGRKRNPEAGVATTDLYGNCTLRHSGTSAAAPEAAGVFALALEANLHLTWRDMQHLTVLTSKRNQLHDEVHRWRRNGVGLEFNHLFGYGVLDAGAMVKMAKDWKTVPERFHCVGGSIQEPEKIPPTGKLVLTLTTDACEGKENFVRYLEHVQAVITVNSTRRGDLNINMTSPMGTKSILLSWRPRDDDSKVGFDKWPFMTTHTWGEDPRGTWALEIGFVGSQPQRGVLKEWTLMLHGTQSAPYIDQIVKDYQSKLAMSKKEELEEELDEAVERSLKSILSKN
ncbi:neuroendocrine convertase 2 isoform X2 [Corvus cornix cornix]|uniref:neuroendocrine convertase 2 isoform X2 n=1 Tax=Corvus moneduloides TaxID=1196302 RepID=UPI0013639326|nr:neuroendocrine convertase 2 isoform X2 [Corvus moneduloides]XP_039425382.1 neuroendocrine convertase 2 isoform X2 [Corvus cornix cornix]XP_041892633.1 neuroendocrine convertase 2 isoform X2 [Corvus kubaryi]